MEERNKLSRELGPLIAFACTMLLLVLYVGSYLAIVRPSGHVGLRVYQREVIVAPGNTKSETVLRTYYFHYRSGESISESASESAAESAAEWIYWPLEQIDRKLRAENWQDI